jgi:flagellar motor component MotA
MYFLSFLGVILISALMMMLSTGGNGLVYFLDFPSALVILLFGSTILLSAGLLKDFNNAFRLVVGIRQEKENKVSEMELRRAVEAVRLAIKTMLTGGVFSFLFTCVLIMMQLNEPSKLGPMLAVGMLVLLYGLAVVLVLLPLEARLRVRLHDMTKE